MANKNILLAFADLQSVMDINQALGTEWATTHVATEAEALALLEASPFDALLVDFNIAEPDASELLNQAAEKCPNTARFLFANEADLALVAAKVLGDHEILPKPLQLATLRSRVENVLNDTVEEVGTATGFDTASSIPVIYDELLQALETPGVTSQAIGDLIARDDALIEETLKLTRSAYHGVPRGIVEPVDAVEALGLDTVKALVQALRFMAEHSHVRPGYLSLERIWQHSTGVARIARDLVLFETKDRVLASQALAAGLLHDLGKVVLATNFDDLYGRVHSLARKQPVALWEIEREMFGASHGEIGACLLGMWNLPGAVVDAAAFHHEPPLGEHRGLTPLAAVHIANVLEHQLHPTDEFRVLPVVNTPFLNELGLLQRMPVWRATFANQRSRAEQAGAEQPVEAVQTVATVLEASPATQSANHFPTPATPTQTVTAPAQSSAAPRSRRWVYTGIVAGVMFMLGLSLRVGLDSNEPPHVHARTIPQPEMFALPPVQPAPEAAPAPVREAAATPAVLPQEELAMVEDFLPEPEVVSAAVVTNVPLVSAVPVAPALPAFRINGIFYTVANPSAVVNGKAVFVGERVNGAKVISIGRNEVTLEIDGERKTISVPEAAGSR